MSWYLISEWHRNRGWADAYRQSRTHKLGKFWLRNLTIIIKPHLFWRIIAQVLLNPRLIIIQLNISNDVVDGYKSCSIILVIHQLTL